MQAHVYGRDTGFLQSEFRDFSVPDRSAYSVTHVRQCPQLLYSSVGTVSVKHIIEHMLCHVAPTDAIKAYVSWKTGGIVPHILNNGTTET